MEEKHDMAGGVNYFEERMFFEGARDALSTGSKNDQWNEFLKQIELYTQSHIPKESLVDHAKLVFQTKGTHELVKEFREMKKPPPATAALRPVPDAVDAHADALRVPIDS